MAAPVTEAWRPGERRTFYMHAHFAQPGVLSKRVRAWAACGWRLPPWPLVSAPAPLMGCNESLHAADRQPHRLPPRALPPNARPTSGLQVECRIPFKLDNPGLLCLAAAAAPTAEEPHRVAVSLANLGTKVVPAGFGLRFAVQLGPG